jgi:potassium-transporting ATPase KdpC subunit
LAAEQFEAAVRELVEPMIHTRGLGYLGEPTVDVLQLNHALAELEG